MFEEVDETYFPGDVLKLKEKLLIASHDDNEEALKSSTKDLWVKVIQDEIESMKRNHV